MQLCSAPSSGQSTCGLLDHLAIQQALLCVIQGDTREAALEAKEKLKAELLDDNPRLDQANLQGALRPGAVLKRLKHLEQRIATRQNELGGDMYDVEV